MFFNTPTSLSLLWLLSVTTLLRYLTYVQGYTTIAAVKQPSSHLFLSRTELSEVSKEIRKSTNTNFEAVSSTGGAGGGSGATTGVISDGKIQYFYKTTGLYGEGMFKGEFNGLQEMYNTKTIAVPKPICYFTTGYSSFLVMEKLNLGGSGSRASNTLFGKQLAQMHRHVSSQGFGFHCRNTIGATHQRNDFTSTWPEFWERWRLDPMLDLAEGQGYSFPDKEPLRQKVKFILEKERRDVIPSLVHGDLWSGNQGFTMEGSPVIFDPACYYGDRECDIAMTFLFGRNADDFYKAYDHEFPLERGWEARRNVYNLYHILNHVVLYGSSYYQQAKNMIDKIISM